MRQALLAVKRARVRFLSGSCTSFFLFLIAALFTIAALAQQAPTGIGGGFDLGAPEKPQRPKASAPKAEAPKPEQPKGEPAKPGEPAKAEEPPAPAPAEGEAPAPEEAPDVSSITAAAIDDRFEDPNALATLKNEFPELYTSVRPLTRIMEQQIDDMARGSQNVDRSLITNMVQSKVRELTSRKNIAAMLDSSAPTDGVQAIEDAGVRLLRPLQLAADANNAEFRTAFTEALIRAASDVLKNHLYARLMLMVALSRSGEPIALPVFAYVLKEPAQPVAVQMLAAIGITNVAGGGTIDIDPAQSLDVCKALAAFLERSQNSFWPAQFRAVQALGALRMAGTDLLRPEANLASASLTYLANPQSNPVVRSSAAWALGMIRPSPERDQFNFALLAYHMGQAAVDIGNLAVKEDATNPTATARYTGLLLGIVEGFEGRADVRESGILKSTHPAFQAQRQAIEPIATRVRAVARAVAEITRAAGGLREPARQAAAKAVADLQAYLEKTPPADLAIYPGGPEFPVAKAAAPDQAGL